jgi:hypothetical protein
MRFQVLTAVSMKIRAFWDNAPCSLVVVDRRFRREYCLRHQGDESFITLRILPFCAEIRRNWNYIFTIPFFCMTLCLVSIKDYFSLSLPKQSSGSLRESVRVGIEWPKYNRCRALACTYDISLLGQNNLQVLYEEGRRFYLTFLKKISRVYETTNLSVCLSVCVSLLKNYTS